MRSTPPAAIRDFDPVSRDELAEPALFSGYSGSDRSRRTFADLDPKIYGVIVEDESETLRGLLLPDIPGVDTASTASGDCSAQSRDSAGTSR